MDENELARELAKADSSTPDYDMDLNTIARSGYSREDREQFAQLIGYSHSGAHDLGYMSSEVLAAAQAVFDSGTPESEARNAYLRDQLDTVREGMRDAVAELYGIHPDDLRGTP